MRILLMRAGPDRDWQPLTHLARSLESRTPTAVGIVLESTWPELPIGAVALPEGASPTLAIPGTLSAQAHRTLTGTKVQEALREAARSGRVGWAEDNSASWKLFALPLSLPPKLLVLGAGPDAAPIVDFAARMNWKITVVDHRPAYADPSHFPSAERVVLARPEELARTIELAHGSSDRATSDGIPSGDGLAQFSAVVVMSHHLPSDLNYLSVLSETTIPYVGLLGPAPRREKLLADLGNERAQKLRARLHAPVGLALGGRSPESIALSIVAEIHAFLHGAPYLGMRQITRHE
jgi:xanthine dehydrogenase accessory factor